MKTFINKVKEKKDIILKLFALLAIVAVISGVTLTILFATNVLNYDDGFVFNEHIFDAFRGKWYGFIVFILIQTVLSMLLCVIPGVAAAFVMFSTVLYPNPAMAFLLSYSCVLISSATLYIIGRLGGYRICEKILGKEDCEKSLELLRTRGTVYFPLMMLFPIFPDDALVMIAGTTKMKLSWFIPSIVLCRGVGAATIIFGMSIVPFDQFTSIYDWLVLITVGFFWIQQLFKLANKIDRYFEKKKNAEGKAEPIRFSKETYLKTGVVSISLIVGTLFTFLRFGSEITVYSWLMFTTICFYWLKEIFTVILNLIIFVIDKKTGKAGVLSDSIVPRDSSVNTCHSIATIIICIGIAIIHLGSLPELVDLITLVTVAFFWLKETFKLANKIDHYFAKKKITSSDKLCGATEQTLEESFEWSGIE
jgi:uncharacterized membrane protein YdjX (TVP38/TMEM64 family)